MRLGRLVEEERPGVVGRLRDLVSTTRAPSSSSRSTYASAGAVDRGRRPADRRRLRQQPDVRPESRGSGTGSPVSTDHISATSATDVASGPTVSKLGHSGKTPSVGMRPQRRLQPDDAAARRGQPDRAPGVGAEPELAEAGGQRGRVAARRAARRAPWTQRVLDGAVPVVLARDRPTRTRAGSPCRRRRRRLRRAARPRSPSSPGRGRRRSSSRRSCGSRRCRSGP